MGVDHFKIKNSNWIGVGSMTTQRGLFEAPETPPAEPPEFTGLSPAAKARLISGGYMDAATGATRTARARRCGGCRRPIWIGIDADWCGQVREGDPGPLSALGEAMAAFFGWTTLELAWMGGKYQLYRRDEPMISGRPAGTTVNRDVLAAHRCAVSSIALPRGPSMLPTFEKLIVPDLPPF